MAVESGKGKEKKPVDRQENMYLGKGKPIVDGTGYMFTRGTVIGFFYHLITRAGLRAATTKSVGVGGACAMFSVLDSLGKRAYYSRVQRPLNYPENLGVSCAVGGAMVAGRYGFARAALATALGFLPVFAELNAVGLYPDDFPSRLGRCLARSKIFSIPAPPPAPLHHPNKTTYFALRRRWRILLPLHQSGRNHHFLLNAGGNHQFGARWPNVEFGGEQKQPSQLDGMVANQYRLFSSATLATILGFSAELNAFGSYPDD